MVQEKVRPEIIKNICHWTDQLMNELTTLSPKDGQAEKDIAANVIHDAIVSETVKQLKTYLQQKKKLSK